MAGTFRFGDLLVVVPALLSELCPGDVVVFCSSRSAVDTWVVHRVVAWTENGVITQGDACVSSDVATLRSSQLLGRVARVQRGDKSYVVWGGFVGQVWSHYVRFRRRLLALGRVLYRWLRASGIVRRLWCPPIVRLMLATEQGPAVKYLCNGKTIAVWQPETGTYWCRKPYDLVLDAPDSTTGR